jgi:hypothetical protein
MSYGFHATMLMKIKGVIEKQGKRKEGTPMVTLASTPAGVLA